MLLILGGRNKTENPTEQDIAFAIGELYSDNCEFLILENEKKDSIQSAVVNVESIILEYRKSKNGGNYKYFKGKIPPERLQKIFNNYKNEIRAWDSGIDWLNIKSSEKKRKKDFLDWLSIISTSVGLFIFLLIILKDAVFLKIMGANTKATFMILSVLFLPFAVNSIREWMTGNLKEPEKYKSVIYAISIIFVFLIILISFIVDLLK